MKLFVRFAKTYDKMHVIELQSLLKQRNESTEIKHMGKNELFCIIEVENIETVDFILERAIFVKSVSFCDYLYFDDFANCHKIHRNNITVRLKITTIETQMKIETRNEIIQRNMQYIGNNSISLTSPDYVYQIYVSNDEEYNTIHYKDSKRKEYLKYDVKYRPFIGITCMDWEISIFMANLCGVNDQSLVLEPFIGSAGIAMACLLFNAHIIGIEYDLKMLYGQKERKGNVKTSMKGSKIHDNFEFINKSNNVVSVINANSFTVNLDCEFDAIITDPPYGDRISLSRKKPVDYIQCLKRLADNNLKRNGMLCFFFPIEYDQETVEIFREYKLVVSIKQVLRSVTRVLYVFEKTK